MKKELQKLEKNKKLNIGVIVGPEGGLSENEVQKLVTSGAKCITLGKRILRTETAPIVMLSIIINMGEIKMPKNTKKENKKEQTDKKEVKNEEIKRAKQANKPEKEDSKQNDKKETAQNSDVKKTDKENNKVEKNSKSEENKQVEMKNKSNLKVENKKASEKENNKKNKNNNNSKNNKNNEKGKKVKKQKDIKKPEKTDKKKYEVKEVKKENDVNNTEKEHIKLIKLEDIKNIFKNKKAIPKEDLKPIRLFIHSYGGDLEQTNFFCDLVQASRIPIITIAMGVAMSAGFLIFLSGHKRYAFEHTQMLVHAGSAAFQGTASEIEEAQKKYKKQIEAMKEYILNKTDVDERTFNKNKNKDWYLTIDELKKYHIIDDVITDISMIF